MKSTHQGPQQNLSLLLDFYELTMAASYYEHHRDSLASFDLFIRDFPAHRSFFLAAGLHDVVDFIKNFHFDNESIKYLQSLKFFSKSFLEFLLHVRFHGHLWAIPEGTVFFPNEPILRVVAPIIEAQLLESFLLNAINLQTTIATKAARVVLAAKGKRVLDFSLRRTQGSDAANKVARAAYIAGFEGTSNVLASKLYGIPPSGTMAHSFIMSFHNELAAFRSYVKTFPNNGILLVDTYDTLKGVNNAIIVARELEKKGHRLKGIRLDSGNLAELAFKARKLLDLANLPYVKIVATGNLDEYKIKELLQKKAPIDTFGVGTKMGVSADAPYCDVIYKLSEVTDASGDFLPTMKLSKDKVTYPGRKQVFRFFKKGGAIDKDVIGLENEPIRGRPLLQKVIDHGIVVWNPPSLKDIQKVASQNLVCLPKSFASGKVSGSHVHMSPGLRSLMKKVRQEIHWKIEKK